MKKMTGTREWSVESVNCCTGCENGCVYCYARYNACKRFHRFPIGEWETMRVRKNDVLKKRKYIDGTIMFPTTHDITPSILDDCIIVIEKLLLLGNSILIVSKPHFRCIEKLCNMFDGYKDKILFRFSIGAFDDEILRFFEPNAPKYAERMRCLKFAFDNGFQTSASVEPMLDPQRIEQHYAKLSPYVTDSIWIGLLNCPESRIILKNETNESRKIIQDFTNSQSEDNITMIYEKMKGFSNVKWKESIKKIVGIPLSDEAGLDK